MMSGSSKRTREDGPSTSSAVQIGRRRKCRRFDGLSVLPEYIEHLTNYALSKGDRDAGSVGKRFFLPASFTGGPRFMYSHYLDALSICRVYGNPQ